MYKYVLGSTSVNVLDMYNSSSYFQLVRVKRGQPNADLSCNIKCIRNFFAMIVPIRATLNCTIVSSAPQPR